MDFNFSSLPPSFLTNFSDCDVGHEIIANWKKKYILPYHIWISGEFDSVLADVQLRFSYILNITCVLFQLGAGSFLLHQFSMIVNSILQSFGMSEEMHNPVSIPVYLSFR